MTKKNAGGVVVAQKKNEKKDDTLNLDHLSEDQKRILEKLLPDFARQVEEEQKKKRRKEERENNQNQGDQQGQNSSQDRDGDDGDDDAKPKDSGLDWLVTLLEPGVTDDVLAFLNYVFGALFVIVLLSVVFSSSSRFHWLVFLGLALGLFLSFQWFVAEMRKQNLLNPPKQDESSSSSHKQSSSSSSVQRKNGGAPVLKKAKKAKKNFRKY